MVGMSLDGCCCIQDLPLNTCSSSKESDKMKPRYNCKHSRSLDIILALTLIRKLQT